MIVINWRYYKKINYYIIIIKKLGKYVENGISKI